MRDIKENIAINSPDEIFKKNNLKMIKILEDKFAKLTINYDKENVKCNDITKKLNKKF